MNTSTKMAIDKKSLKEGLSKELDIIIEDLRSEIDSLHKGVDLDEEDTMDPEDFSHQTEAGNIERSQEQRLHASLEMRARLEKLPTHAMSEVGIGAVIETDAHLFYISIAARPYLFNGRSITPLSTQAPLYETLSASKVGDTVQLSDKKEIITRIW